MVSEGQASYRYVVYCISSVHDMPYMTPRSRDFKLMHLLTNTHHAANLECVTS